MSEPTLWQPDFDRMYDDERQMFDALVKYGRLVPVVRCEHGNAAGHHWLTCEFHSVPWCKGEDMCLDAYTKGDGEDDWCHLFVAWCPGAGIGDNDEK